MANQSPIFEKTEAFMVWLLQHTEKYPKHERFRLAKCIDDALLDFHLAITRAVHEPNTPEHLRTADAKLNILRTYLKLGLELKHTNPDQYHHASAQVEELGRLLGGWIKKA